MPGFSGPNAQTLSGVLLRGVRPLEVRRERWETPDGDFLDADVLDAPPERPHLLILHGLEGSSKSGYVIAVLRFARERGWGAFALNFRSCSGESNRALRSYNSGDTTDARQALELLRSRTTGPLFAVGFSLGASVLLNLLAEDGERCVLSGAASVSCPFDLLACARAMDQGRGWVAMYREIFVRSLKAKSIAKARAHPGKLDVETIRRARGIEGFDEVVTAPLYGFSSAAEYYARCSSGPKLTAIRVPTALITSMDDPLVPNGSIPEDHPRNPWLSWIVSQRGGHVGFIAGTPVHPRFWAEEQVVRFFDFRVGALRR